MTFGVKPSSAAAPLAQQTPGQFPNYIQFRFNGVDLGGPDATVVDFVGSGWVLTRGTGEDAGKITVALAEE